MGFFTELLNLYPTDKPSRDPAVFHLKIDALKVQFLDASKRLQDAHKKFEAQYRGTRSLYDDYSDFNNAYNLSLKIGRDMLVSSRSFLEKVNIMYSALYPFTRNYGAMHFDVLDVYNALIDPFYDMCRVQILAAVAMLRLRSMKAKKDFHTLVEFSKGIKELTVQMEALNKSVGKDYKHMDSKKVKLTLSCLKKAADDLLALSKKKSITLQDIKRLDVAKHFPGNAQLR